MVDVDTRKIDTTQSSLLYKNCYWKWQIRYNWKIKFEQENPSGNSLTSDMPFFIMIIVPVEIFQNSGSNHVSKTSEFGLCSKRSSCAPNLFLDFVPEMTVFLLNGNISWFTAKQYTPNRMVCDLNVKKRLPLCNVGFSICRFCFLCQLPLWMSILTNIPSHMP